ncbi:unnamed protein product [Coccothraustes coccothraustes]
MRMRMQEAGTRAPESASPGSEAASAPASRGSGAAPWQSEARSRAGWHHRGHCLWRGARPRCVKGAAGSGDGGSGADAPRAYRGGCTAAADACRAPKRYPGTEPAQHLNAASPPGCLSRLGSGIDPAPLAGSRGSEVTVLTRGTTSHSARG